MKTDQLKISGSGTIGISEERSQKENCNSNITSPEPKIPKMIPEKVHNLEVAIY
jgi:hypothetical protein